jgi:hypothetical protein
MLSFPLPITKRQCIKTQKELPHFDNIEPIFQAFLSRPVNGMIVLFLNYVAKIAVEEIIKIIELGGRDWIQLIRS